MGGTVLGESCETKEALGLSVVVHFIFLIPVYTVERVYFKGVDVRGKALRKNFADLISWKSPD